MVYQKGIELMETDKDLYQPNGLLLITEFARQLPKMRRLKMVNKRISANTDILRLVPPHCIRVVTLLGDNGASNHAVSMVGNYIFDSNEPQALILTTESLNRCCSGHVCVGFKEERLLVPQLICGTIRPYTKHRGKNGGKKRNRRRRKEGGKRKKRKT